MRQIRTLAIIFCLVPLGACSFFMGSEKPHTLNENKLAVEYEYQGALTTLDHLVDSGVLSASDKATALEYLNKSKTALDQARKALDNGWDNQDGYLQAANATTLQLIQFLESRKAQ